jgi:ATP-dependent exoDNAse (exonuclease V) beta subunit
LQQVQNEGITVAVRYLISKLSLGPDAVFSKTRLKRLVDVAMDFDRLGDPSIDRFLSLVEKTRLKENEARGVIRIMTIHQSKGLGFDAVIVPVKPRSTFSKMDSDTLVTSPADVESPVVTLLPPKVVCQQIPEYLELYERLDSEKTYETLCTLYVALTRAKQSLQVILPAAPKSGGSLSTVSNWMRDRIGHAKEAPSVKWTGAKGLAQWGSENWNEISGSLEKKQTIPQPFLVSAGSKTLPRLEPSREASHPQAIDREFTYVEKDGRDLGSRVHALLEHIEWADEVDTKRFFEEHNEGLDSEAALHITKALTIPEFARPADAIEVWREQRFESVLPEGWITGIFDRVVFFPNGAWIQDFKTNQQLTDSTIENYRPQMELYRRVLADMVDLPPESIKCQLLFTKTGEVVEV